MELRIAAILLLLAGWFLMLAAVLILSGLPPRTLFCLAGLAVEILGFVLLAQSHTAKRNKQHA